MEIILPLQVLDVDVESVDYRLIGTEEKQFVLWVKTDEEPTGEDYKLEIETDSDMKNIINIIIGSKIETPEQDIKDVFLALLLEAEFDKQTDEADGFEHTHDKKTNVSLKEYNPYDPKLIRVDTKPFSVEHVCKLITAKKLDISPDFQREFVWTEITRKSRLIESIMLRIPIPVFYLSQDEDGNYQVVDGIQRLTVINDFVNNKFRLKNLEYLTTLEGKWFRNPSKPTDHSISQMYSGRIEETQLFFNIIDPSTPEQVKYDIFRRINTGGKTLNAQEIRNCLSNVKTRQLLKDMVELNSFLQATRGSVSRTRMADKEMALRFAAFYLLDKGRLNEVEYKGSMDDFLDLVNEVINKLNDKIRNEILCAFDVAMKNAFILFGDSAFRKVSFINKALFLSWSRQLHKVNSELLENSPLVCNAKAMLNDRINSDALYNRSISTGTNDIWSIDKAYEIARLVLEEIINV
ncbi:hypothetical protein CLHUN_40750 [Ruminiclostridium hungatei]|uniref:GmrSD restriction endonucleases N-terminal domain-containing protein n=1 Tax=Ruminiclostridium hungatei TaxID=48256 RepID=A0A1V4SEY9_RUMHU|nr:DUF262 domain-containing protein [Ruminiclostridium hungatei]OPX42076.1 hypothetical protein CLHUN_40750 [Ruminiclostridium hungatei]